MGGRGAFLGVPLVLYQSTAFCIIYAKEHCSTEFLIFLGGCPSKLRVGTVFQLLKHRGCLHSMPIKLKACRPRAIVSAATTKGELASSSASFVLTPALSEQPPCWPRGPSNENCVPRELTPPCSKPSPCSRPARSRVSRSVDLKNTQCGPLLYVS